MGTGLPFENEDRGRVLVSVIIVNYNGRTFLKDCLTSLIRFLPDNHEIIVVDNNSQDGSCEYLVTGWPQVQLISSDENLGFARGNNIGVERAKGDYLLLINNDTIVLESVQPLIDYLQVHADTAVTGGRLLNPDGSFQPSIGYTHTPVRILFSWMIPRSFTGLSRLQLYDNRLSTYERNQPDVDWLTGAYLCIKREIWKEVSGFDPDIFMYVEDEDLCYRIRQTGARIAFVCAADICHFEGGGKKGLSSHALLATADSYRLLLNKRYGRAIRGITCGCLSLIFLVRSLLYFFVGIMRKDTVSAKKAVFYRKAVFHLLWG